MRALLIEMVLVLAIVYGCKPDVVDSSAPKTVEIDRQPARVTGNMCDQLGGTLAGDETCRCENGVAIFKLLGQTCAQMLTRQKPACNGQGGQILYDDEKCLCFPNYDQVAAGGKCQSSYPKSPGDQNVATTVAEQNPKGACGVLEKATGIPHKICFEAVDLEGCDRSFQVAFEQMKPEFYEIVFFPGKNCAAAKLALKSPARD